MSYKKKTAISKAVISVIVMLLIISAVVGVAAFLTNGFSDKSNVRPVIKEYTVTFVADEEIVDIQKYTEEDIEITVPEVPEKKGYTGEWEEYSLNNKDITVNAVYSVITYKIEYLSSSGSPIFVKDGKYSLSGLPDGNYPTEYTIESGDVQISLLKSSFSCGCPKPGGQYAFHGWYLDTEKTIPFDGVISAGSIGDFVIYADIKMTHSHNY